MNAQIDAFYKKFNRCKLETEAETKEFISDVEKILGQCPSPDGEERKALAKLCSHAGCMVVVFGNDLDNGIPYYRKSIELDPESYDLRWEYYTTLEEIVEDEEYSTPELIQDAIDCLTFCIDFCDTPELRGEKYVHFRYIDLGRVYMAAGDYRKARECFKSSMRILPNDNAHNLLAQAEKKIGNPITRFFKRLFSVFRKEK